MAKPNQIIKDPKDDVIYTDAIDINNEEITYTDQRPNVDIRSLSYIYPNKSTEVTIELEVEGVIENRNDLDDDYFNPDDFTGSIVTYFVELETSYRAYQIEYVNNTCRVNQEETDYTVSGSYLSITFDLETANETFESIIGYTTEIEIVSLVDMRLYMDIVPNEALFLSSITAPETANIYEQILFTGTFEDFLGLSNGPYTYTWDFDDGTVIEQSKTIYHAYQYSGVYTVTLTISDSTDFSSTTTHTIQIDAPDSEPPTVDILKPIKGLYVFNNKIRRYLLRKPIIIGEIDIDVEAMDDQSAIQYVEFFINGEYVHTDFTYPYSYHWSEAKIFRHRYTISVVAFDEYRNCGSDHIQLKRYF